MSINFTFRNGGPASTNPRLQLTLCPSATYCLIFLHKSVYKPILSFLRRYVMRKIRISIDTEPTRRHCAQEVVGKTPRKKAACN